MSGASVFLARFCCHPQAIARGFLARNKIQKAHASFWKRRHTPGGFFSCFENLEQCKIGLMRGFVVFPVLIFVLTILVLGATYLAFNSLREKETEKKTVREPASQSPSLGTINSPNLKTEFPFEPELLSSICSRFEDLYTICLEKRKDPVIYAVLYHYGDFLDEATLNSYVPTLEERFNKATGGQISLKIFSIIIKPMPQEGSKAPPNNLVHNYSSTKSKYPWIKDESVDRIWYYDNINWNLAPEAYEAFKKPEYKSKIEKADIIITLTEAQFEAIALRSGRMVIAKQPTEVAWVVENPLKYYGYLPPTCPDECGYSTRTNTIWHLSDEIIHEIGHAMGLQHPSQQCSDPKTLQACCKNSPNASDVMSPCRDRSKVSETFFYKFENCTSDYFKKEFIPLLQNSGYGSTQQTYCK